VLVLVKGPRSLKKDIVVPMGQGPCCVRMWPMPDLQHSWFGAAVLDED